MSKQRQSYTSADNAAIVQRAQIQRRRLRRPLLAKLLRLGLSPEGYICLKEDRAVRDLLQRRQRLVQQRTANVVSIQNRLARTRGKSLSANAVKRSTPQAVEGLLPDPIPKPWRYKAHCWSCAPRTRRSRSWSARHWRRSNCARPTSSAHRQRDRDRPGLTITLETGPVARFGAVGNCASYCRCVGSERLSNGKRKGRGNTKKRQQPFGVAYMEAANFAVRYNAAIERYYQGKRAKTNAIVAIKTVPHKLVRACYCMPAEVFAAATEGP
jgi:transposase